MPPSFHSERRSVSGFAGACRDRVAAAYPLGNGHRYYLPAQMRFSRPDGLSPFGRGGINPYAYCAGDPLNHSDPSGRIILSIIGIALGGLAAGVLGGAMAPAIREASALSREIPGASAGRLSTVFMDTVNRAPGRAAMALGGLGFGAAAVATGIASVAVHGTAPELSAMLGMTSLALGVLGIGGTAVPTVSMGRHLRFSPHPRTLSASWRAQMDVGEELDALRPRYATIETGGARQASPPAYEESFRHADPPPSYVRYDDIHHTRLGVLRARRSFSDLRSLRVRTSEMAVPPSRARSHSRGRLLELAVDHPNLVHSSHNPWGPRLLEDEGSPVLDAGADVDP
ncbi:RHS repeat-associated core domain-containing protein [Bordetella bronchialis]|uniref:RHS repeat-associated core domain-containing protein n=1 Tax=Bordetella bronchialis TaxID=463025 RepID=A0ABM6CXP0_9BORD|nr:RHS repeat-associated core domain-containing protein [Bordetella bronchialis]ANN68907.1 hypothetical protein BAU06_23695 [Bordetella bronchialis]